MPTDAPARTRRRAATIRRTGALLIAACLAWVLAPPCAGASLIAGPSLSVPSATLMTIDGAQLWSRSPNAPRRVASCIKMLNALVVRDRAKLTDTIIVCRKAEAIDNGDVGLVTGQRLTVDQLLHIMLVHSANDAAEALAVGIAGSEAKYVALMNAKAKALGLTHTHATDPHGLGKRETSTAHDLAVLAQRVLADPVLRAIVRQRTVPVPRVKGPPTVYGTTDGLLGSYKGMEGVKTGYTGPAGYCFVGAAKRGRIELVGVVLGADSNAARFSEMRKLLDWGFANYFASDASTVTPAPLTLTGLVDGKLTAYQGYARARYTVPLVAGQTIVVTYTVAPSIGTPAVWIRSPQATSFTLRSDAAPAATQRIVFSAPWTGSYSLSAFGSCVGTYTITAATTVSVRYLLSGVNCPTKAKRTAAFTVSAYVVPTYDSLSAPVRFELLRRSATGAWTSMPTVGSRLGAPSDPTRTTFCARLRPGAGTYRMRACFADAAHPRVTRTTWKTVVVR